METAKAPYSMWRSVKWRVALSDRRELAAVIVRGVVPGPVRAAVVLLAWIGCDGHPAGSRSWGGKNAISLPRYFSAGSHSCP